MNSIEKAREYATKCHADTNHLYDGKPYTEHLELVVRYAEVFGEYLDDFDHVIEAAWCHDVIEDCRQTYNDVKQNTCVEVADLVYALTNEKGRNRSERANNIYYEGIRALGIKAVFIKMCDRLANTKYSIDNGSHMAEMYLHENPSFVNRLCDGAEFLPLRDMIATLLGMGRK